MKALGCDVYDTVPRTESLVWKGYRQKLSEPTFGYGPSLCYEGSTHFLRSAQFLPEIQRGSKKHQDGETLLMAANLVG